MASHDGPPWKDTNSGEAVPTNLGDLWPPGRDMAAPALIDLLDPAQPRRMSHAEVRAEARAVARALRARGLARGERVAILSANRAEFVTSYFGAMMAGLVAVPVSWRFAHETVQFILRDCEARLILVDSDRRADCPRDVATIVFGDDGRNGFDAFLDPGPFETVQPGTGEIAMFLYTSGSSGRPKGVPLSHAGQLWVIETRRKVDPDCTPHRFLVAAPLYHMNALISTKIAFANHASLVLLPEFTAPAYIRAIEDHGCSFLTSVPTMLALVARERALLETADLSSVEIVMTGSSPVTQKLMDQVKRIFPGALIANAYGTTEAGAGVFGPHPDGLARPDVAIGHPVPGIGIRLVDDQGRKRDQGVLQMNTPAIMPGYHNLAEKTAERMTADGWYDTGDVMSRDADGFYTFVGRADEMFNCGGENVYPGDVEALLERHPDIDQACVVPVADEIKGQKPVAFVVARAGAGLDEAAVKAHALRDGPAYQHPRRVFLVDHLPLAATNKIDRVSLIARAVADVGPDGV